MICKYKIRKYLIQLDDTGMADQFENVNFSRYSLHVSHVYNFLLD